MCSKLLNKKSSMLLTNTFRRSCLIHDTNMSKSNYENAKFSIVGRLISVRSFGKACFVSLKDASGGIQLYFSTVVLNKVIYTTFLNYLIAGSIIWCRGTLFKTKNNNLCIRVFFFHLLVNPQLKFPSTWFGLKNIYKRSKYRYLDLFINQSSKLYILKRIDIIQKLRFFLKKMNYQEVETPMLHFNAGGATAFPFSTYNNVFKKNLYLRIAPELFLKKLIIAGFEKIFELNRCFRNEGVSFKHSFEFTSIEIYEAYADYFDYMKLTEKLIKFVINSVSKEKNLVLKYKHNTINFNNNFNKINYLDSLFLFNKCLKKKDLFKKKKLQSVLKQTNIYLKNYEYFNVDELQNTIFEKTVIQKLIQPTFIINHPSSLSPLAKRLVKNNKYVERFELYIAGFEIADGFSELNDPSLQKHIFLQQVKNKKEQTIDNDYINALKYGLPPTAGVGMGIDRLTMIITNAKSINDVIFFPFIN